MHIKLTETLYIEPESIDFIELSERYGEPWVEVWAKRQDFCGINFRGDEADEAWSNWQTYMREAEARSRNSAEGAVPKIESPTKSEDDEQ